MIDTAAPVGLTHMLVILLHPISNFKQDQDIRNLAQTMVRLSMVRFQFGPIPPELNRILSQALIVERCHHAINSYGLEISDDPNAPILLLTTYAATNPDSPYRRS